MSKIITLIATNLAVIIYTIIALRVTNFDEFPPNKYVFKVRKYLYSNHVIKVKKVKEKYYLYRIASQHTYSDLIVWLIDLANGVTCCHSGYLIAAI